MRLSSSIFTLLLSTAHLSFGATISARELGLFKDLPGTDEAKQRNADYCVESVTTNKRFSPRATVFAFVEQGKASGDTFDDVGYRTAGLVSCFAAAVTGTTPDGLKYKVLGHFQAAQFIADQEWDTFATLVRGMNMPKESMKGFVSYPDVETTPKKDDGTSLPWGEDDKKYSGVFFDLLNQKVLDLTGTSVQIVDRPMSPPATSSIETVVAEDGSKSFLFKSNSDTRTST